jgi:hypothetical protein
MPFVAAQKFGDRIDPVPPTEPLRLQQLERFGIAAALEKMAELRVDLRREGLFEAVDFFGDFAEADGVVLGVAAAGLVGNDGEAFAESGGEVG